jgi:hypothetical protein
MSSQLQLAKAGVRATVVMALLLGVAVVGCACRASAVPNEVPGITGIVTQVASAGDDSMAILVEGGEQPAGAVSDKALVTLTPSTRVLDPNGRTAPRSNIVVGVEVKVWFTGPVALSYPVQGAATVVQLTGTIR